MIETLPQEFGYRAAITLATDKLAFSAPMAATLPRASTKAASFCLTLPS